MFINSENLLKVLPLVVIGILLYKVYRWWIKGKRFEKNIRMDGKVVIITGANTGIGKVTAIDLARRGAKVYMACRNLVKSTAAAQDVINQSGSHDVILNQLDLSSFKSIREFVENFEERRLDVLINNAGIMACPKTMTKEGIEIQIGVNHFGHFLLTLLLLNKLKKSAPSRILNVSSLAHRFGKIDKGDLLCKKSYSPSEAYARSKLANILFTKELARRLKGTNVTVNALHPGAIYTELQRHIGETYGRLLQPLIHIFGPFLLKTPEEGAQTTIACAVDPDLETISGEYFSNCEISEPSRAANDPELAKWLWKESVKITKTENIF